MAHKRPPLEINAITESLKESKGQGVGAFFPTPPNNPADDQEVKLPQKEPNRHTQRQKAPLPSTKKKQAKLLTSKNVSKQVSNEESQEANVEERILASLQTTDLKENTFRYTQEELDFIRDIVYEAEVKYKTKLNKNDVVRIGLEWLIVDWRTNNEESLLARILTSKKARR
jgi:hypothetical protein